MKFTKNYLLSSLALAGALVALPVCAQEMSEQIPSSEEIVAEAVAAGDITIADRPDEKGECGNRLGLTDAQLEKMASLKDQFQLNTAQKKAELKSLFRQMRGLMTQPTIDRGQITGLHDKMNALRTDLSNARLSYMLDRADVLTPDQRKQIHHFMLMREVGHGGRRHGFGHHHGGPGCSGPRRESKDGPRPAFAPESAPRGSGDA